MYDQKMVLRKNYYYFFVTLVAVFFPALPDSLGNFGAMVVNLLIISLCFLYFTTNCDFTKSKYNYKLAIAVALIILPFLLLPISMSIGVIYSGVNLSARDFFDFYRPVLSISCVLFGYLAFNGIKKWSTLPKFWVLLCGMICFLAIVQFSQSFPFLSGLYTKYMNIKSNRVAVPFVNPYDFAFVMSLFFFFFLFKSFFERKYNLIFAIVIFVLIFLSQSRSGFIALSLSIIFIFVPYFTVRSFGREIFVVRKSYFIFIVFCSIFIVTFFSMIDYIQENFRYFSVAFEQLASGQKINSASIRIEQFNFAMDKANDSILVAIFGNGPAKEQMPYVESIYTYLFYRFGLFGFVCYWLFWLLYVFVLLGILKRTSRNNKLFCFFCSLLVWVCSVPLFSISNNLTEQLRTSFFYYSLFGVALAYYHSVKTLNHYNELYE